MKVTTGNIDVSKITLDLENPRLFHERLTGKAPSNEKELMDSISRQRPGSC